MNKAILTIILLTTTMVGHTTVNPSARARSQSSENAERTQKVGLMKLLKASEKVANLKKFSMDVEYVTFYESDDFSQPHEQGVGRVIRHKDNFYQEELGNTMLVNANYEVYINEQLKEVSISPRLHKNILPSNFDVQKLEEQIDSVSKIKGGYCYYTPNDWNVEKMDILFDENGFITVFRRYHRFKVKVGEEKEKVISQLKQTNINTAPKIPAKQFDMEKYVMISSDGEVRLTDKYKAYELTNYLE